MKRPVKMLMLLAACAVLIGGYFAMQAPKRESGESGAAQIPLLSGRAEEALSGLAWTQGGERLDFSRGADGRWVKTDSASFPVSQDAVSGLVKQIFSLAAVKKLTGSVSPADYGLDGAAFSLSLRWADGGETVCTLGHATPFADGYYIGLTGRESGIYIVPDDLKTAFDRKLTDWAEWERTPRIPAVTRMTVGDFLDVRKDENGLWRNADTQEILETGAVEKLTSAAKRFSWNELVSVEADEEEMRAYGLDAEHAVPLTLYDGDDVSVTVLLGKWGSGLCYARLPDSRMVYTVSSFSPIIMADVNTLYRKDPFAAVMEHMASVTLAAGDISLTIAPAPRPASGAGQTQEEGETSYLINGTPAKEGKAEDVLSRLSALTATDRVETEEWKDAVLTVRVTDPGGAETQAALLHYDDASCILPVHEKIGLLFPAGDVDALIGALEQAD